MNCFNDVQQDRLYYLIQTNNIEIEVLEDYKRKCDDEFELYLIAHNSGSQYINHTILPGLCNSVVLYVVWSYIDASEKDYLMRNLNRSSRANRIA